ncbi:MAG TPA: PD-(D/E)XK nuclease family protein [Patescibacteria group bacterium]|nr:PD-(D/E)XK nuclease family protein [Patescibacteria group bacterium]
MREQKKRYVWVSHSSIGDYLSCPRLYYIRHIYRNPKTNNKVNIISPALALGSIVHTVLESLSVLPVEKRFTTSLLDTYHTLWVSVSGEKGGFSSDLEEQEYKNRGAMMLNRVMLHPGPLLQKAVKITSLDNLPHYVLSEEDSIILCGKVDWLEYLPFDNSVHVIDFKTGIHEENENSLQLPIYSLLVQNTQKRTVSKMSYWYLDKDNEPREMPLPDLADSYNKVLDIAKEIKQMREKGIYVCAKGGCFACRPLESIVNGTAQFVTTGEYNTDIFITGKETVSRTEEGEIPF